MSVDDLLLTGFEGDPAFVLLAGAVLGKQTSPVLGVRLDLDTARLAMPAGPRQGHHPAHRLVGRRDQSCLGRVAEDGQMVLPGLRDDVAVAEVEAEHIGVGRAVDVPARAAGAVHGPFAGLTACFCGLAAPPADGPAREVQLLRDHAVRDSLAHERDRLCVDRRTVLHAATLRHRS
ncbi:hypothetical protein ACWEO4_01895 [Streptomyces sp. NPDC004393]|uniref:hypothetical protein n=1 Tax=Streptomyces sp. NPDC004533 TaxID=3154278 RepID=UPI0033A5B273